jgi:hypothetical protein
MFGSAKIIEALATIKADTKNHNGELQEFKETFNRHRLGLMKKWKPLNAVSRILIVRTMTRS